MDTQSVRMMMVALLTNCACYAMEVASDKTDTSDTASIIPNASYMIYEGEKGVIPTVSMTSQYITFYTADGEPIKTIEHGKGVWSMQRKLDPMAPKPQPVLCMLRNVPDNRQNKKANNGGDYIVFYDKHDNNIYHHPYNDSVTMEQFAKRLDLSIVREAGPVDHRENDKVVESIFAENLDETETRRSKKSDSCIVS